MTFRSIAEELLALQIRNGRAGVTVEKTKWLLEFAYPTLGNKRIALPQRDNRSYGKKEINENRRAASPHLGRAVGVHLAAERIAKWRLARSYGNGRKVLQGAARRSTPLARRAARNYHGCFRGGLTAPLSVAS